MYDTTTVIDYVRRVLPDFFGSDAELKAGSAYVNLLRKLSSLKMSWHRSPAEKAAD